MTKSWGTICISVPTPNSGGLVPPSSRDLRRGPYGHLRYIKRTTCYQGVTVVTISLGSQSSCAYNSIAWQQLSYDYTEHLPTHTPINALE